MVNWGIKFLDLAKKALPEEEGKLLEPLRALWDELLAPRDLIFKRNIKGTKMAERDEKEIFERIIEKCEVINALS